MATRLSISKLENPKDFFSRLPRFSVDLRINNTRIQLLHTPLIETIARVIKEKKGLVHVALKQFDEFEESALTRVKTIRKKARKSTAKA